ncbi:homocysteine S-methyltransferase family protein [Nisaea sediminum]|uniref:homocysteine S-methyltransferase family protein n=1 Tax=Nisaea sediminum TaxID=2775867 RepID=UPI001867C9BA|nr:homocysteine S-methyltransferase family protein [Nisaea sediminum]
MMQEDIVILDGGMSRELERLGAPFRQPEWSALALIETPEIVERVHAEFIDAGAEVITTNNYAVVPFHIGEERFAAEGGRLIELSGRLARSAADRKTGTRVAGSIPPVFGSYLPQDFDPAHAPALLGKIVSGLARHVDLWLIETTSSIEEMKAAAKATSAAPKPLWVSYTLEDGHADSQIPTLRSGEPVRAAVEAAVASGAEAVLFNCSAPEVMEAAVKVAVAAVPEGVRIGVYANAFAKPADEIPANDGVDEIRHDLDPAAYAAWARRWKALGATLIGGCCGIGCGHIAALRRTLKPADQSS